MKIKTIINIILVIELIALPFVAHYGYAKWIAIEEERKGQ